MKAQNTRFDSIRRRYKAVLFIGASTVCFQERISTLLCEHTLADVMIPFLWSHPCSKLLWNSARCQSFRLKLVEKGKHNPIRRAKQFRLSMKIAQKNSSIWLQSLWNQKIWHAKVQKDKSRRKKWLEISNEYQRRRNNPDKVELYKCFLVSFPFDCYFFTRLLCVFVQNPIKYLHEMFINVRKRKLNIST